jgi:hypothetical protein
LLSRFGVCSCHRCQQEAYAKSQTQPRRIGPSPPDVAGGENKSRWANDGVLSKAIRPGRGKAKHLTSLRHRIGRRRRKCPKLRLGRVHRASGLANLTHHPLLPHSPFCRWLGISSSQIQRITANTANASIVLDPRHSAWRCLPASRLGEGGGPGAASLEGLLHYERDALSQDNWSSAF